MNCLKIHIFIRLLSHQPDITNTIRIILRIVMKLTRSEIEHKHLIIVQRPGTMTPCGFKHVLTLKMTTDGEITSENTKNNALQIRFLDNLEFVKAIYG